MSTKSVMGTTATGRPRNRSWPEALKREIVAASFAPGSSVSIVARQYDVNANQVFNWRKRFQSNFGTHYAYGVLEIRNGEGLLKWFICDKVAWRSLFALRTATADQKLNISAPPSQSSKSNSTPIPNGISS